MFSIFIAQKDKNSLENITLLPVWIAKKDYIVFDTAMDGHTAISLLIKNHYDLVILDVQLPDIDIFTLLSFFYESGSNMPFIITAPYLNHITVRRALQSHAVDYLLFPVQNEILEEILSHYLISTNNSTTDSALVLSNIPDIYASLGNHCTGFISMIETYVSHFISSPSATTQNADAVIRAIIDSSICWFFEQLPFLNNFLVISKSITFKKLLKQHSDNKSLDYGTNQLSALQDFILNLHPYTEDSLLKSIFDYVLHNIDSGLSQKSIAKHFYQTNSAFSKMFYEKSGLYFSDYIMDVKLLRAEFLLLNTTMKVYEISNQIGYRDYNHFSKIFRNKFHQSPTEFRLTKF